jgi:outer membrane receptor protein involved in Fe transport
MILAALSICAFAQNSGSITGTVKDSGGGVIPGVEIAVTDQDTAYRATTSTNAEGNFIFPQLPAGTYTLTAEAKGFKKSENKDVILPLATKVGVGDIVLQVGAATDTVTVEASPGTIQVQADSGERSDIVTNRDLREIGLNGQNIIDMMKFIPGINVSALVANAASTVTNITGSFQVNGTRSLEHEYTLDGITNLNLGNNTGALVSINPDAVEEVKILTSNYQAEYGRSGGGVIALTTRGGANEYHGGGSYFRRHDSMNADSYFNDLRGGSANNFPRPLYRYNYYGWNFGGPVFIPHLVHGKNKLFFFVSQEYYSQLVPQATSNNIRVPTMLERTGDFSQSVDGSGKAITIIDPTTGVAFPGDLIPSNRIYAPGQAILNFLPQPNTTLGGNAYNYTSQIPSAYPRNETILRGDWNINSSTRMSVRWAYNHDDQQFAYGTTTATWNWPLTITDRKNGPGSVPSISLTKSFGPTVVNEFVFGIGRGGVTIAPEGDAATRTAAGINTPMLYPTANVANLIPSLTFGGIASVGTAVSTSVFGPFEQRFLIWQVMDNLTKVHGGHEFKVGFYFQSGSNASNNQTHVESDIDFTTNASNPLNSGNPFSNALLGVYNSFTQANAKPYQNYLYHDLSGYAQDTWKVNRHLTLDLGVRFSWYQPVYNTAGDGAYFNPSAFVAAQAMRLYRPVCVGVSTCSSGAASYRAIDPATTGAATLSNTMPGYYVGKLVSGSGNISDGMELVSAGYPSGGVITRKILPQPRLGFAYDVTGNHKTVVRGGFGIAIDRYESGVTGFGASNPPLVLQPTLQYGYLQNITSGGGGVLSPLTITGVTENMSFPHIYSYSIGVQRDIGMGAVIDISYVGSKSRDLPRKTNLNTPGYGTTFTAAAQDPTKFVNGVIPATEPSLPTLYSGAGLSFSGVDILGTDFLRPYQGYSDITWYVFDAQANYNSLQASLQRRFSQGLTFGVAYTLSKTMTTISDDGTFTRLVNPALDYQLAAFDRTHYLVGNFVWDLPKASRAFGGNKVVGAVFDHWVLSGVTTLASGMPTDVALSISGQDAGNRLLGSPTSGNLSGQQPRFLLNGDPQSGSTINMAALEVPGLNDTGPYPRTYLRFPWIANQDLSVFKNITMGGEGKRYIQLRLEAFNALNHPQISGYNLTSNVTNGAGQTGNAIFSNFTGLVASNNIRPAGNTSVLGNYFGEPNNAQNMRVVQLAVKFYF